MWTRVHIHPPVIRVQTLDNFKYITLKVRSNGQGGGAEQCPQLVTIRGTGTGVLNENYCGWLSRGMTGLLWGESLEGRMEG